jgi:phage terminase large subunit
MWTIADSAEPKSIDELRSFGMKIKGAKKGPGSVEFGIKFCRTWRQIIIDPERCPLAAREFINYRWRLTGTVLSKVSFRTRTTMRLIAVAMPLKMIWYTERKDQQTNHPDGKDGDIYANKP